MRTSMHDRLSGEICVRIWGGLGNQMFQYAAGHALAKRLGVDLLIDPFEMNVAHAELGFRLFNIEPAIWTPSDNGFSVRRMVNRLRGKGDGKKRYERWPGPVFRQANFCSDDGFAETGSGSYLFGYFQSERFFADQASEIRSLYSLDHVAPTIDEGLRTLAGGRNTVSVHIRRGDYAANPTTTAVHGILGDDYYDRAHSLMAHLVPDCHWLVFSDDIDAADHLTRDWSNRTLVSGQSREQDLCLMSACANHVIANSSFSWWGAWLGHNPDKQVIGPRRWFSRAEMHKVYVDDVCPVGWILI